MRSYGAQDSRSEQWEGDLWETYLISRAVDICNCVSLVGRTSSFTVGFCSGVHSALRNPAYVVSGERCPMWERAVSR